MRVANTSEGQKRTAYSWSICNCDLELFKKSPKRNVIEIREIQLDNN